MSDRITHLSKFDHIDETNGTFPCFNCKRRTWLNDLERDSFYDEFCCPKCRKEIGARDHSELPSITLLTTVAAEDLRDPISKNPVFDFMVSRLDLGFTLRQLTAVQVWELGAK